MIGRRGVLAGSGAMAAAGLRKARAARRVAVASSGGGYAQLLASAIDKPLIDPLDIQVDHTEVPPERLQRTLIAERGTAHGSMDVVCLCDIDMYIMSLLEVLRPVTATAVPRIPNAVPWLRVPYAVPHVFSLLVVLYDPERVKPAPRGFADLWNPKWRGRVGFSDLLDLYVIGAASLAADGSMSDYARGMHKLEALKGSGAKVYATNEALGAAMQSGEIWITPALLGFVTMWRDIGIHVRHAFPVEGAIPYTGQAAVPKNAPDQANGLGYLNAMLDPKAQADFARQGGFLPTVENVTLPAPLLRQISFTAGERGRFRKPDYDYLSRNVSALRAFWNKTFKS